MNILTIALMIFAVIGFIDKAIGGRLGLEKEIDTGLSTMGTMSVYIMGIYCLGTTLIEKNAEAIAGFTAVFPMDPSVIIGCLLAPDLGGQAIALELASDKMLGYFSGVIVGGCLGQFISFQLPVVFSILDPSTKSKMIKGFVNGIVAVPFGLLTGGLVMGIAPLTLLLNMSIITLGCAALLVGFLRFPAVTEKILLVVGAVIKSLCQVSFIIVIADIFLTQISIVPQDVLIDALFLILRMTIIICGGLAFAKVIIRFMGNAFERIGSAMGTGKLSLVGLMLNMINSLTVVSILKDMDDNGKAINAAFSVSGAYILGGQLALVLLVAPSNVFAGFVVAKLTAGFIGVGIAVFNNNRTIKENQVKNLVMLNDRGSSDAACKG